MTAPKAMEVPDDDVMLTASEAAVLIGGSPDLVRKLVRTGQLPALRLGQRYVRVRAGDLRAFIASHMSGPPVQPEQPAETQLATMASTPARPIATQRLPASAADAPVAGTKRKLARLLPDR